MIRLDKLLSELGIGTRKEVKKEIRGGLVKVNGAVVRSPEYKADEAADEISYKGQKLHYQSYEYYMLNKPAGVISATRDDHQPTVVSLIKSSRRRDLFPVGRLDKDTEGLLLITNDGEFSHRLMAPSKHVAKTYLARVSGPVGEDAVAGFAAGVDIGTREEPEITRPAVLNVLSSGRESTAEVTISEGKYHQIKRMFHKYDLEVLYLKRMVIGGLVLDEKLSPGEYRPLTKEELDTIC